MSVEIYIGLFIVTLILIIMDAGLGFIFALLVLCLGEPDLLDMIIKQTGG